MLYFLHLAYKGTAYQGWQRQVNGLGVQQVVEEAMTKIFRQKMVVHGCGRTDAGVHASQFFAHVLLPEEGPPRWLHRLNKLLPKDIAIYDAIAQTPGRHAQFDAISRTYRYHLHLDPDPFLTEYSTFVEIEVSDLSAVQQCIVEMDGRLDFRAFCKQPDQYKDCFCDIEHARWQGDDSGRKMFFEITANRFLRGMVRLLVGNLLEVLAGRLPPERFLAALKEQRPLPYFNMAYPQGLYLTRVVYR